MNGSAHRLVAGSAAFLFIAQRKQSSEVHSRKPLVGGLATALFTCLSDVIEPVFSPNHRQFFHRVAWASLLIVSVAKLRGWQPTEPGGQLVNDFAMLVAAGYLIGLALDATTAKSLSLFGNL